MIVVGRALQVIVNAMVLFAVSMSSIYNSTLETDCVELKSSVGTRTASIYDKVLHMYLAFE